MQNIQQKQCDRTEEEEEVRNFFIAKTILNSILKFTL